MPTKLGPFVPIHSQNPVLGPQLKVIGTMSVGYNHIDLKELKARGIKLANTPNVLNGAVADIAMLLALAAARRLPEARQHVER